MTQPFVDRKEAGTQLARAVGKLNLIPPVIVLGLPRGGVPVAYEIALALGATVVAAIRAARQEGAKSVIVAAEEGHALVGAEADRVVVLKIPAFLMSIGQWYERFDQLEDAEVCDLLRRAA